MMQGIQNFCLKLVQRHKYILIGVLFYVGILFVYISPVLPDCSTRLLGSPGDQTGFAWLYEASPKSPLWGETNWSNAPFGENVSQPVYITGLLPYTATWLLTKVVNPICAFNVITSFGFIFTSTMMFVFVLWLTKRKSYLAAWLAGYLVAFSPYMLIKTPYHPSYVFAGILVALLWALIAFWRSPGLKIALLIMGLLASVFYHDPYFILLAGMLSLGFLAGSLVHNQYFSKERVDVWKRLRLGLVVLPVFLVLIAPVLYVRIVKSSQINSVVGESRDTSIIAEGRAYGARPWEYVLPAVGNPLTPDRLKDFQRSHQHGAAITETTIYLGIVPLGLATWYLLGLVRHRKQTEKLVRTVVDQRYVAIVASSVIIIAGLFSLAPFFDLKLFRLHLPSEALLRLTSMWRVPARLFVVVHIGIALLAALGFLLLLAKLRLAGWKRHMVIWAVILASFLEFLPYSLFNRSYWSYRDVPATYTEIKNNSAVDTIAEYPLLDPPRDYLFIFYMTYQTYHRKPMINSVVAASPTKRYRESLTDTTDWQTLGVLKQLGVDRIVIHSREQLQLPGLTLIQSSYDNQAKNTVTSWQIDKDVKSKDYVLTLGTGFDGPSKYSYKDIDFFMHQYGELKPVLLPNAKPRSSVVARIEYYAFEKSSRPVQVTQEGKLLTTLYPTESKQDVKIVINPEKPLELRPQSAPKDYSFVISNLEVQ